MSAPATSDPADRAFACQAVLPRAVAVLHAAEDLVEQGLQLCALHEGGTTVLGRIVGIRQHRTREAWTVLELDRDLPRGWTLRGRALVAR